MGFTEADKPRAVLEAQRIVLGQYDEVSLKIPLHILYDAHTAVIRKEENRLDDDEFMFLDKLDAKLPQDLFMGGPRYYYGDLEEKWPVSLSYVDLECIGLAVLAIPEEVEVMAPSDIDLNPNGEEYKYKDKFLNAFLVIHDIFVQAGGRRNDKMVGRVTASIT